MNLIDITSILFISIISAFVGFGFNKMMEPGMLFEFYRDFLEAVPWSRDKRFPYDSTTQKYKLNLFLVYLVKPLGKCIVCNTTWIGILIASLMTETWNWQAVVQCVICGVASAGIVIIIVNVFNKLQK